MNNPNPDREGWFYRVVGSTWAGVMEQWVCALCGSPAIARTRGAIACVNSSENCQQGGRLYALPVTKLEPFKPV
jgi:hypothetical protein